MEDIFKIAIVLVIVLVIAIIIFRDLRERFMCAISLHDWTDGFDFHGYRCSKCLKKKYKKF